MSDSPESREKPQAPKPKERGSILNYFKKQTASPLKACNDEVVDGKEQKVHASSNGVESNTTDEEEIHMDGKPSEQEAKHIKNVTKTEVKETLERKDEMTEKPLASKSVSAADDSHSEKVMGSAKKLQSPSAKEIVISSSEDSDFENPKMTKKSVSLSKGSDEKSKKQTPDTDKSAGKSNIFAFMMANRSKQNEIIKKMAEEEDETQDSDKAKCENNETSIKKEKCEKNNLLMVTGNTEMVKKKSKNTKCVELEDGKSASKKKRSRKKSMQVNAKESIVDAATTNSEDDFERNEMTDENICKEEQLEVKEDKTALKSVTCDEIEVIQHKVKDCNKPQNSDEVVGNDCKTAHSEEAHTVNSDSSTQKLTSNVIKSVPASASLGNAFTLLMTNRHKMNNKHNEKKDDSTDESSSVNGSKPQRKRNRKLNGERSGCKGQKRKRAQLDDLDSSLCDFDVTPKKKKKTKRRRRIVSDCDSSEGEEQEICFDDASSHDESETGGSSDETDGVTDNKKCESEVLSHSTLNDQENSCKSKSSKNVKCESVIDSIGKSLRTESKIQNEESEASSSKIGGKSVTSSGDEENGKMEVSVGYITSPEKEGVQLECDVDNGNTKMSKLKEIIHPVKKGSIRNKEAGHSEQSEIGGGETEKAAGKADEILKNSKICNAQSLSIKYHETGNGEVDQVPTHSDGDYSVEKKKCDDESITSQLRTRRKSRKASEKSSGLSSEEKKTSKENISEKNGEVEQMPTHFDGDYSVEEMKCDEESTTSQLRTRRNSRKASAKRPSLSLGKKKTSKENISEKNNNKVENSRRLDQDNLKLKSCNESCEPPVKRRKRCNYIASDDEDDNLDSSIDILENKIISNDSEKKKDGLEIKKGNISAFFKKMSKEEMAVERSKNTITVKVDVHAPLEGLERKILESPKDCSEAASVKKEKHQLRRSNRKTKKELDDFDKIEVLEQVLINSPKKAPSSGKRDAIKSRTKKKVTMEDNAKANENPSLPKTDGSVKQSEVKDILGKKKVFENASGKKGKPKKTSKNQVTKLNELDKDCSAESINDDFEKITDKKNTMDRRNTKAKPQNKKGKAHVTLPVNKIKSRGSNAKKGPSKLAIKKMTEKKSMRSLKNSGKEDSCTDMDEVSDAKEVGLTDKLLEKDIGDRDSKVDILCSSVDESLAESSEEIFVKKKRTIEGMTKKSADDSMQEMSEDKENIVGTAGSSGDTPKKMRLSQTTSVLKEGSLFNSYDELKVYLEILEKENHGRVVMKDSRTISSKLKLTNRALNPSLKYAYLRYGCGSTPRRPNRRPGRDSNQSCTSCPWTLRISLTSDGQSLYVKDFIMDHNHSYGEIEDKEKYKPSQDDPSDVTSNSLDEEDLDKKSHSVKNLPLGSTSRHRKNKQPEGCKTGAQRKLLSSQDNIQNQIKTLSKTPKMHGKVKKRSPRGKKRKLSLNKDKIMALQSEVIEEMAKAASDIQVNMTHVDEELIDLSGDSPGDKQKSKIPPLVLKPPPKEQKPLKMKGKKKKKRDQEEKGIKKNSKDTKGKETAEKVCGRPSRRAAANALKTFLSIMDSEDSDAEELSSESKEKVVELDSDSKEKGSKVKASKTVSVKAEKPKPKVLAGKEGKLAPIFCKRSKSPELQIVSATISPSKMKARQEFLQSGVPEQLKKQQALEKCQEELLAASAPFPKVSHVQQKDSREPVWNLDTPETLQWREMNYDSLVDAPSGQIFEKLEVLSPVDSSSLVEKPLDLPSVIVILKALKRNNPAFPVFSVFKFYLDLKKEAVESYKRELDKETKLKCITLEEEMKVPVKRKRRSREGTSKRGRRSKTALKDEKQDQEMGEQNSDPSPPLPVWQERIPDVWTQVYAPKNSHHMIGNKDHVERLREWLLDWKTKSEDFAVREKSKKPKSHKKDDFIVSDDSSNWSEDEGFTSTYLLCGPPGIGKTATVYALAAELGYKVLEVNASSKRPGKQVMTQLAEATQSHSVSKSSTQPNNAIAELFAAKSAKSTKTVKQAKKTDIVDTDEGSQGCSRDTDKRKGFSLVLFEDIDIVFEESDEGFISTVNSFMTTTKRPIILTISHPSHSSLSKIRGNYDRLDFEYPSEELIAQHLQLMCLVNGQHVCFDDMRSLVSSNHSDIRQSILDSQVWSMGGSSGDICSCLNKYKDVAAEDKDKSKDITLADIFSESICDKFKDVEVYKKCLWGKVHSRYITNLEEHNLDCSSALGMRMASHDLKHIHWTLTATHLPYFLPFTLKVKKMYKKYPLDPKDPLVKMSYMWQKYNWLSTDDEEEENPSLPSPKKDEKLEEPLAVPEYVKSSSQKCIESLSRLCDTYADLDVLESLNSLAPPRKDEGQTKYHLIPGLSDSERQHVYFASHTLTSELAEEYSHRSLDHCSHQTREILQDLPTRDWEQFSLPVHENFMPPLLENQVSSDERLMIMQQSLNEHVLGFLPLVRQFCRDSYMDYLSFVRSIVRHDELCTVVKTARRGKRFLSQTAQYGFDISSENKVKLANSLCT